MFTSRIIHRKSIKKQAITTEYQPHKPPNILVIFFSLFFSNPSILILTKIHREDSKLSLHRSIPIF